MTNHDQLLHLLSQEIQLSAQYVTQNRLSEFRQFNKSIGKMIELLEDLRLPSEEFMPIKSESPASVVTEQAQPDPEIEPEEESVDDTTLYGYFKQQLPKVVDKFWEYHPDVTEDELEHVFETFVTKRAQYTSQGFPANDIAEKLKLFQGEEPEVDLSSATEKLTSKLETEEDKEKEILFRGPFIQGLQGGSAGHYHIHEGLVRSMHLEHGRNVTVLDRPSLKAPFTIVREDTIDSNVPENKVLTLDYALVEEDEFEKLVIRETIYGEEIPDYFPGHDYWQVPDNTIHNLKLSDGDIVELHYYAQDFASLTVNYVYSAQGNKKVETAKKRYASDKKEKIVDSDTAANDYLFDLQGTRILIVGAEPYWGKWRKVIEDQNGVFDSYDKHSPNRTVLSSKVQNADIVIAIKNLISHASWWAAKDFAKEYNVHYQMVSGFGNGIIFRLVADYFPQLLEAPEQVATSDESVETEPQEKPILKSWQDYAAQVITDDIRYRALPKDMIAATTKLMEYAVRRDRKSKPEVAKYLLQVFEDRAFNRNDQRRLKKLIGQLQKDAGNA